MSAPPTLVTGRSTVPADRYDVGQVDDGPAVLAPFNEAGVLHPADIHTAATLCELTGTDTPGVLLATALAVRGPRIGHVCVDLATVADTATDDDDDPTAVEALPWPRDLDTWLAEVAAAATLVAHPAEDGPARPLTLDGSRLYLDRYWRYELGVAQLLIDRTARTVPGIDLGELRRGLDELFGPPGDEVDLQRLAAATAVTRSLAVVAGGPGTGKTTTVARILALLDAQAAVTGAPAPRVALAAPTGKAAGRLEESLREALERDQFDPDTRERLAGAEASTIHRLLRRQPGSASRFRHHAGEPLPHDVVIVDEASMVSLALMAKLVDALPGHARLILVGDPQQLRSVEAGAVLGDIVGPALSGLRLSASARATLREATGEQLGDHPGHDPAGPPSDASGPHDQSTEATRDDAPNEPDDTATREANHHAPNEPDATAAHEANHHAPNEPDGSDGQPRATDTDAATPSPARAVPPPERPGIGDGIVVLQRMHRFGARSGIADLAAAIQAGDEDAVVEVLGAGQADVAWLARAHQAGDDSRTRLSPVRTQVVGVGVRVRDAAATGDARAALDALEEVRVLCAHRRGPFGVSTWVPRIEGWLGGGAQEGWPVGRPVMATRNDHQLRIYNGDVGVVVGTTEGPRVAFPTPEGPRLVPPTRLEAAETVHAMTIHKSQGSQFGHAVVVLPGEDSRILSRELFYTGVTRARRQVTVIGSEAAVRAGVRRVVHRASGLRDRLWGPA